MIECVKEEAKFSRDARDLYIHAMLDRVKKVDLDVSGQPAGTHIPS